MTNRIPLIVNAGTAQIQELPSGDALDLGASNITNAGTVTAGYFVGDGSGLTNVPGSVAESPFSIQTANFTAVSGSRYGVNTTPGPITCTLPLSPVTGAAIYFSDAGGAMTINNFTVNPQINTIMNNAGNVIVNTNGQSFGVFWNGATWRIFM